MRLQWQAIESPGSRPVEGMLIKVEFSTTCVSQVYGNGVRVEELRPGMFGLVGMINGDHVFHYLNYKLFSSL